MLKYVMLAGAMTVAVPVLAQTTPQTAPASPTAATTVPQSATPTTTDAAPAATDPAAMPAAEAPAATGSQVAGVVDTEFPAYDKDGDGKLSKVEFGAWMVALKSKSDPTTKADSPATKTWVGAAFAQADTDKNQSLSKTEVTGFLSQGQS